MASLAGDSKIIVTGGAGFIGSALIAELNTRGLDDILVIDILGTDDKWKNLAGLKFRDYLEYPAFLRLLADPGPVLGEFDCIFHLGACSATTERNASYLVENNYAFTRDLASLALRNSIRFVYASSAATYGDGTAGMNDRETDLHRFRPLNMYGYSKHMFDLYAHRTGILQRIAGVKYFNVFGPNEYHKGEMRSLVCKAHEQIRQTGKIRLFKSHRPDYTDGGQMRDFLYVKDAVAMTIHLAEHPDANGLFNLGSGVARTWLDLAHALFAAMELPPEIEFIDMPESIRNQYQYYTCADISKLRETGYTREVTPLEAAVADYVKNYLSRGAYLEGTSASK